MLGKLIFIILISCQNQAQAYSSECMEVVVTDCARNFCDSQTQTDLPTADLCQLACKLDESSCQSWAFIDNGDNIVSNAIMQIFKQQFHIKLLFI